MSNHLSYYSPVYMPGLGSRPRLQSVHPFRHLVAAGSNVHPNWSSGAGSGGYGTGNSGYGAEHPDYDYQSGPAAHVPSGGGYSYHATADTGYGVPPPPPHPPAQKGPAPGVKKGGGGGGGKKGFGSSTAMNALTLLSFFFFVNLLQNCIKDHMDAMNPTVMIMTTNVRRKSFNKMGEVNSREQSSSVSSSSSFSGNDANIVRQPADMVAAAATINEAANSGLHLQSPYSGGVAPTLNNPMDNQPQYQGGAVQQAPPPPGHMPQVYQGQRPQNQRPIYDQQQTGSYEINLRPQPEQYYPQSYPQQPMSYKNHSHSQSPYPQMPSIFSSPQQEHDTHFHYTPPEEHHYPSQSEYSQNSRPHYPDMKQQSTPFSTPYNPFYDYKHPNPPPPPPPPPALHPPAASPQIYKGHRDHRPHQYENENEDENEKYQNENEEGHHQGPVPWSSRSTLSGPYRRASIVALTPSPKWVSSNINDQNDFASEEEERQRDKMHSSRYGEIDLGKNK